MNKETIVITGSNGQLGQAIKSISNNYSYNYFFTTKDDFDINNRQQCKEFINKYNINCIINCAAYTNVEKAEIEINKSNIINSEGPLILAELAIEFDLKLIHISTDYVFDGNKSSPYIENDETNPINQYGISKLKGEKNIQILNPSKTIIIRSSWIWSEFGNNFYKQIKELGNKNKKLKIIDDQISTPTNAIDLAKTILKIIPKMSTFKDVEIFHFSNEGVSSWYDLAYSIISKNKIDCDILPIKSKDYLQKAKRPSFTVMDKDKIKNKFDIIIPNWKQRI